jgi:hypothetical protein
LEVGGWRLEAKDYGKDQRRKVSRHRTMQSNGRQGTVCEINGFGLEPMDWVTRGQGQIRPRSKGGRNSHASFLPGIKIGKQKLGNGGPS